MHLQENALFDLDLEVEVAQNVSQYPLHHGADSPARFEVAMSNCQGGDAFARKCIIQPLTFTLWSRSHKMLPSTL